MMALLLFFCRVTAVRGLRLTCGANVLYSSVPIKISACLACWGGRRFLLPHRAAFKVQPTRHMGSAPLPILLASNLGTELEPIKQEAMLGCNDKGTS